MRGADDPSDLPEVAPFTKFSPTKWQDEEVPERRWLVGDNDGMGILARGTVTLLTGDGGVGKSLLAQQLQTAIALGGENWAGISLPADPIPSVAIYCEDDEDELHRRQAMINATYGVQMSALTGVNMAARVGEDNILAHFTREDRISPTPFYDQITTTIRETGAQLIIIDTAADTFGGNENYRAQVRSFINLLRRWPMEFDGGLILTAHPSNFGVTQGTGISGSTAWNNSVRSRIYLTRPKDDLEQYGEDEDTNERVLKIMKSNYGPSGSQIRLRWEHGVFAPVAPRGSTLLEKSDLDNRFVRELGSLVSGGTDVLASDAGGSKRTYTVLLKQRPGLKGYQPGDLRKAKERLLENGKITLVTTGPPSNRMRRIRPAELRYPEEA